MTAGDFDGDGLDELLVEASHHNGVQNGTYLFDYETTGTGVVTEAAATAVLLQSSSSGFCHRSIGDVNNDGYDDVDYSSNCNNSPEIMYGAPDFASNGFTATGLSMGNYVTGNNYFGYPFMQDNYEVWDYNGDGIHDHLYAGFSQPEHIAGEITWAIPLLMMSSILRPPNVVCTPQS